jgi:hypothetical protein
MPSALQIAMCNGVIRHLDIGSDGSFAPDVPMFVGMR